MKSRPLSSDPVPSFLVYFFLVVFLLPIAAAAQVSVAFSSFRYDGHDPWADAHPLKSGLFLNPILSGMYPDPSIVRVNDDYYLVNSTFAWYPGIPIFHSRDLFHWEQIGFVLNRPSQLDLDHLQVSGGIFAPTIRYHHGIFYVITTLMGGFHTFYVTAKNPAGPWSDPIKLPELDGIDPSFFFDDDGRAYIVHNGLLPDKPPLYPEQRAIWLVPFDVATGKVSGPRRLLVNGGDNLGRKPCWIEGPHLFRHNGYYYLIAAQGGTSTDHSEVVFRSPSLSGPFVPYAGNPILTQRTSIPIAPLPSPTLDTPTSSKFRTAPGGLSSSAYALTSEDISIPVVKRSCFPFSGKMIGRSSCPQANPYRTPSKYRRSARTKLQRPCPPVHFSGRMISTRAPSNPSGRLCVHQPRLAGPFSMANFFCVLASMTLLRATIPASWAADNNTQTLQPPSPCNSRT
jgi:Glycosyl hydrolases family 43